MNDDIKDFTIFGEIYLQHCKFPLHIVDDNRNQSFLLLKITDAKIKSEVVNAKSFKSNHKELFSQLPPWMKCFFGFQNIFTFISEENSFKNNENIKLLEDFVN